MAGTGQDGEEEEEDQGRRISRNRAGAGREGEEEEEGNLFWIEGRGERGERASPPVGFFTAFAF
eukprot:5123931-Pyramimonas_sp.AAC.2